MIALFVFVSTLLGFINQKFMWCYSAFAYGLALTLFVLAACGFIPKDGLANDFVSAQTGFSLE
jgi:hypothetical protein